MEAHLNLNIMDLTKRKEELLAQKEKLEQVKKDAHQGIIAINVKLRKLEGVTRDAEELFDEKPQAPPPVKMPPPQIVV